MESRVVVTGATGNTGRVVAELLRARGVPFVAMARSTQNRARLTPTRAAVESLRREFEAARRAADTRLAFWIVIPADEVDLPPPDARAAFQANVRGIFDECSSIDLVVLGDSVRVSLMRAGLRAMAVVTRTGDRIAVHGSVESAISARAVVRDRRDRRLETPRDRVPHRAGRGGASSAAHRRQSGAGAGAARSPGRPRGPSRQRDRASANAASHFAPSAIWRVAALSRL